MALNAAQLVSQMAAAAKAQVGPRWNTIKTGVTIEFNGLARRLVLITRAFLAGDMTKEMVKEHLQLALTHVVSTLAMVASMAQAAAQAMVNAALGAIKSAVNTAVGFVLL